MVFVVGYVVCIVCVVCIVGCFCECGVCVIGWCVEWYLVCVGCDCYRLLCVVFDLVCEVNGLYYVMFCC